MDFAYDVNILAVLVATAGYFLLGALWYSPILFAKPWMRYLAFDESKKANMPLTMLLTFVAQFVICFCLAILLSVLGGEGGVASISLETALKTGLLAGVGFMLLPAYINNMYAQRPFNLLLIDAGYHLIGIVGAALTIGSWY